MIKVKVKDLLDSIESMNKLVEKPLHFKLAYKIARIARAANEEIQAYETARNKLFERYAERDEQGNIIKTKEGNVSIAKDKTTNFLKELTETYNTEVDLNVDCIEMHELEALDFTPIEIHGLLPFIK